jgi:hypothetical protein
MSEPWLYIKHNGRYREWGKLYSTFDGALPFGIWWVRKNAQTNIEDRLISDDDLKCPPVVARRIAVKERVLQYFLDKQREGKALSYDDMANELAKILVPSQRKRHETKGVRLRHGNRGNNSRST